MTENNTHLCSAIIVSWHHLWWSSIFQEMITSSIFTLLTIGIFHFVKNCKDRPFVDFQKSFSSDLKLTPLTKQFMGSTCGKSRAIIFAENVTAFLEMWHFIGCFATSGEKKSLPYTCTLLSSRQTNRLWHPNHPSKSPSLLFSLVKTLFLVDGNEMQIRNDIKWIWIPTGFFKSVPKVQYGGMKRCRLV